MDLCLRPIRLLSKFLDNCENGERPSPFSQARTRKPLITKMPNETSSSEKSNHQAWSEHDVFVLLCALNDNIETIRDGVLANRENGVASASTLLSERVGNNFTPEQVEREIMRLWKRCGPPSVEPSSPVDPMYLTGAWTRTLPFLDALYPAMLGRVALAGKVQDR